MAATLNADQEELRFFSFPIEKQEDTAEINPVDGTPDILIWGKATDGTIDGDNEIVDPEWSAKALQEWAAKGNIRMNHDPKRPVGRGQEVQITTDGHWVKSLIADPLAKHFIRIGALNDYSVGISNPDFRYGDRKLDPEGKALRVITGRSDGKTRIAELSIVDRGSNFNSAFQIVRKAAGDGGGFTGKMIGSADEIAKGAPAALTKNAREEDPTVTVDVPKSATITFSPADLAKLLEHRRVAEQRQAETAKHAAETAVYKRDIDTATRRRLAKQGRALPDGSYPIENHADAGNAVTLALSGHGNVSAAKKLIRRIARKEGWHDIIERLDHAKKGGSSKAADPEAAPVTAVAAKNAPPPLQAPAADTAKADSAPMHRDDGQDDDTDSDADAMDKAAAPPAKGKAGKMKPGKAPCPKCGAKCKGKFCGKCGAAMMAAKASKPTPADHAAGAAAHDIQPAPPHREPDGPAVESFEHDAGLPTVPDSSVKTAMRLRDLGVPPGQGMLHGLLCPAYGEDAVKAAWPGAGLSLADEGEWQAKALEIATSAPLDKAQDAMRIWQAAITVKTVPPDLYGDIMAEARKAFRDANPGPGTAPQPGEISAQRFNRPYLAAGHSAPSPDHGAPHSAPVHPGHISAADFRRGLITEGHAADAPENSPSRPEPVPAPAVPGVPSRVFYTNTQRQNARQAMQQMHDHIAMTFPDLCPMHGPGRMGEQPAGARPVPAGIGGPVPHRGKTAEPETRKAAKVKKAGKKEWRKLVTQVAEGAVSIEEVRARLDPPGEPGSVTKAAAPPGPAPLAPAVAPALDPDLIKAAIADATAPLLARLDKQDRRLKKQAEVLDAIAGQPDPAVTAYRGAAIAKGAQATMAPAGPVGIQQRAALAQETFVKDQLNIARNSADPTQRLEAFFSLADAFGLAGGRNPVT